MPDPAPSNVNPNPNPGEGGAAGNGGGDGSGGGTPPAGTPPAANPSGTFDPAALTPEQLNQVLEKNPHIWKTERLVELRDKASKFTKLTEEQQKAAEQKLKDEKKFEELSTQQASTIEGLQKQLRDGAINQALTNKLAPLGVVDLEAALALADRSKITVAEDGTISGVDEVIEALKTGKQYLFNGSSNPTVGNPTNPSNGGANDPNIPTFKRSQLRDPKFYQEHREDILKAQAAGKIEDDLAQ